MRARAAAGRIVVASAIALSLTACGVSSATPGPPTAGAGPTQPAAPPQTASATSSSPTASPPSAPPSTVVSPTASVPLPSTAVDPGLLAILPETVGGLPIVPTPEAAVGSLTDPAIQRSAASLATGYVVSAAGDDWAVVSVVALRPGTWSEAFYRDWRDSYGAEICRQEGGVGGRASATIEGREIDIATCGGLRTYNVHLDGRDVVVSVASAGEGRFGEQVMAGLRP